MKLLSYSAPWPSAIQNHNKRTENRDRWLPHPHLLGQAERMVGQDHAIHTSGTWDKDGAEYIYEQTGQLYTRKTVLMKAITSVARIERLIYPGDPIPEGQERWYFGGFALLLANVRVLPQPVLMAGGLGWLEVPERELKAVQEQLEGMK